jgi:CBS domain-containing protein
MTHHRARIRRRHLSLDRPAPEYGGMRSDAFRGAEPEWRRERGEFGWGGGGYDVDFPEHGHPGRYPGQRRHGAREGFAHMSERIRVADLMTPRPATVAPDDTIAEAARRMKALDVGILPVVESRASRQLAGIITDRDIAVGAVADDKPASTPVAGCMSRELKTVHRDDSVRCAMEVMGRHRVRRLPVVDAEGRLEGILTQADLAVRFAGFDPAREIEVEEVLERISEPARPRRPLPGTPSPNLAHLHGGYVFGPTDRGGDVGFRSAGSRGLDEW